MQFCDKGRRIALHEFNVTVSRLIHLSIMRQVFEMIVYLEVHI